MKKKIYQYLILSLIMLSSLSSCVPAFLSIPLLGKKYQKIYENFLLTTTFSDLKDQYQLTYSYYTYQEDQNIYNYEYAYQDNEQQAIFKDLQDSTLFTLYENKEEKTLSIQDGIIKESSLETSYNDYSYDQDIKNIWNFIFNDNSKDTSIHTSYLVGVNRYWVNTTFNNFEYSLNNQMYTSGYLVFSCNLKKNQYDDIALSLSTSNSDAIYRIEPPKKETLDTYHEQFKEAYQRI